MIRDETILIVDDEVLNAEFIISGLKSYGYTHFIKASSAASALEKLSMAKVSLVILDITLERNFSGIFIAREIDRLYKIPVIFITGRTDKQMVDLIEKSKMFGVLFKPFKIQTLRLIVKAALNNAELLREAKEHEAKYRDQVKRENTFFELSRLMTGEYTVKQIINKAMGLIPKAFSHGDLLKLRISYRGIKYVSENFKETKWVLSGALTDEKTNLVELYLDIPEEAGGFPFSLEEIETFNSIIKEFGIVLKKISAEERLERELYNNKFTSEIMFSLLNKKDIGYNSFIKEYLLKLYKIFKVENLHLITFSMTGDSVRRYSLKNTEYTKTLFPSGLSSDLKRYFQDESREALIIKGGSEFSDANEYKLLGRVYKNIRKPLTLIPVRMKKSLIAVLVIEDAVSEKLEYILVSQNTLINTFILGIENISREKKLNLYYKAIEQNPASVVITDVKGNITFVNPVFSSITGYREDEVLGRNPRVLKSGEQSKDFYKELWDTILDGKIWSGEFHNKRKDGSLYWEYASISPIRDDDGTTTGFLAVKEDITEKVEAEHKLQAVNKRLKETQSSLVMEEKLASIGRLAAGVAHEINNPIGFISSNFRTIKRYFEKYKEFIRVVKESTPLTVEKIGELEQKYKLNVVLDDMDDLLAESDEGFERVITIVNSLRSFSRVDQMKSRVKYDLNKGISTTLTVARNQIKQDADVEMHFNEVPLIYCNSSQINQVLLNIIINSAQAIAGSDKKKKGKIDIFTYVESPYVCCKIKDNGPGIPEDVLPNIFEPFFTTKPVGEGTGLGLNISYDIIVNKHNGQLLAGNNEEGGAWFIIKLPLEEE